ncbi:MAG TPA: type II toxin-antitoxin system RelE/ParE family toxin [Verrucomicrobiae bacterium]|nr:type II toxin-antitoxin system RelE/ParE family toxin [Verrucomicrobiae bacterium]
MSRALQVYYTVFDHAFWRLPPDVRRRIEAKIDEMGTRLGTYPHYRMTGTDTFRLRIGDYRVIYEFDAEKQEIYLLSVGHRREVYR